MLSSALLLKILGRMLVVSQGKPLRLASMSNQSWARLFYSPYTGHAPGRMMPSNWRARKG